MPNLVATVIDFFVLLVLNTLNRVLELTLNPLTHSFCLTLHSRTVRWIKFSSTENATLSHRHRHARRYQEKVSRAIKILANKTILNERCENRASVVFLPWVWSVAFLLSSIHFQHNESHQIKLRTKQQFFSFFSFLFGTCNFSCAKPLLKPNRNTHATCVCCNKESRTKSYKVRNTLVYSLDIFNLRWKRS